jgi:pimeloyl-ACP methyl ester carboxylesterase
MRTLKGLIAGILMFTAIPVLASDLAKEKRWADQIVDELIDGDAVWLEADGQIFLSILTPAQGDTQGGVIVMHGIGVHPNWPQVVYPLRVGLAEHGWTTLSLQMPILPNEAEAKEYIPLLDEVPGRIRAGIVVLKEQGAEPIFLVTHSLGSGMARHFLAAGGDPAITGFVGVGMPVNKDVPQINSLAALKKIQLPVLDLYGENDLKTVIDTAGDRAAAAKAGGNRDYVQVTIPGADHFFDGFEERLVQTVADWLLQKTK